MAKRKTPARGKGGRFTKSSTTTAVARSAPRAPTRRRRAAPPARRATRRRRSVGGTAFVPRLKSQMRPLAGSIVYGWITNGDAGTTAGKVKEYLDKVPTLAAIGKPATHGLLFTFVATKTRGMVRSIADALGTAALHRAAYNLGASNFNVSAAASLGAGIDDGDLSGEIDDDEAAGYDDDAMRGDDDYE